MYQDIIDGLVLPFGAEDVQGFFTKNNAFYIQLKTGEVFNPTDMADVETTQKQRIKYITNNLRNAFNQLSRTGLSEEEILQLIKKRSTNSPQIE